MLSATFSSFRVPSDTKEQSKKEVLYKLTIESANKNNNNNNKFQHQVNSKNLPIAKECGRNSKRLLTTFTPEENPGSLTEGLLLNKQQIDLQQFEHTDHFSR